MLSILKRNKTKRSIVILLVFGVIVTTVFSLYKLPKSAKAGIDVSGNDIKISNGIFDIGDDGTIYQEPFNLKERNIGGDLVSVPKEYYAYLFDNTGKKVTSSTNLTVESNAVVMMEGTQNLANLTVKGKVNQPYPDREGKINKPVYTVDHWMGQFTGFLKLDANSRYYLTTWDLLDDYVSFEIGDGDTVSSSTSWKTVYSHTTQDDGDDTGANGWAIKNTTAAKFQTDSDSWSRLENTTASAKYVPIRVRFADKTGATRLRMSYRKYNSGGWTVTPTQSDVYVPRSSFCGLAADGKVDKSGHGGTCGKVGDVNFDYYISDQDQDIQWNLSHAVRSAGKVDFNLMNDFSGGFGDYYGDSDNATWGDKMMFYWDTTQTPYGSTWSQHSAIRASRYSGLPFNAKAYDSVRRVMGGLTLNVAGDTKIPSGGIIDLRGYGYPGYSVEMGGASVSWGRIRGGSVGFGGAPGGGYSNAIDCNGAAGTGGSHAGTGGYYLSGDNDCRIDKHPDTYDNKYNPSQMGSGGGASDDNSWTNISGSGGGLLKLTTKNLIIDSNHAIDVDGDGGEYVQWHSTTGGAGGSINITINGRLTMNASKTTVTARGSNGQPSLLTASSNRRSYIGGGGGMIYLAYASSNLDQRQLKDERMSVEGGDGGNWSGTTPNNSVGGNDMDGTVGTLELAGASVSTEVISITKETFDKDGKREATFEAGDQVTVKLHVYDPGSSGRDDFKIEDFLPKTTGTVAATLTNPDGTTATKNLSIGTDGKITLLGNASGSPKILLKPGDNTITYTYTL